MFLSISRAGDKAEPAPKASKLFAALLASETFALIEASGYLHNSLDHIQAGDNRASSLVCLQGAEWVHGRFKPRPISPRWPSPQHLGRREPETGRRRFIPSINEHDEAAEVSP